jgi:endoglucanase
MRAFQQGSKAAGLFLLGFVACDSGSSARSGEDAGEAGMDGSAGSTRGGSSGSAGLAAGTGGASGRAGSAGAASGAGGANSAGSGASGADGGAPDGASGEGSGAAGGSASDGGSSGAGATSGSANGGSAGSLNPSREPIPATSAAAAMGKGFNLGQMFENAQHPATLEAARPKIDAYYAEGFRLVRIPVTWTERTGGELLVNDAAVGDVNRAHSRLAALEQVVDYALSKTGMYVVLNAHHEKTLKTESRAAVLERLWADIADIFAERDYRLIFEILNEPHRNDDSPMPPEDLRDMTGKAYVKIRAVDTERLVVIGGNQWFGASEMATVWPDLSAVGGGQDSYVMATFHHYNPWTFCGDNQGTYDDAWTEADLSDPMETMLTWAENVGNGMPVFIGEWGVGWGSRYQEMDCNNIRLWYASLHAEQAAPRGMPTAVWDDGGWFKIYDHTSNAFANNLVDCIGGACALSGDDRFNSGCD